MDILVHCETYSGDSGATSMLMMDVWWYENLTVSVLGTLLLDRSLNLLLD